MPAAELERSKAVEQATGLFWSQGYDETSVEDIVKATGLNRYAIYNQFGGKREMLLEAIDAFYHSRKRAFLALLEDPSIKPFQAIQHMFGRFIDDALESGNGCLMCNTISEIAPKDEQVADVCRSYETDITEFFTHVLSVAQAAGDMRADLDPASAAQALLTFKVGLGTRAKAGTPRGILLDAVDAQISALHGGTDNHGR